MTYHDAMMSACNAIGIKPPRRLRIGQWVRTDTLESNGKGDASVLIFDDQTGGIAWNWQTQQRQPFSVRGNGDTIAAPRRDPEKEKAREQERLRVMETCERIVRACEVKGHPYFEAKGFPTAEGLVIEDAASLMPSDAMGRRMAAALPEGGPLLVIPGRRGKQITTLQFITPEGAKKNILGGQMGGACHRIATGRETWVCEGIATAMSIYAALGLLGRSATVLSAFSASNVGKVAESIRGAVIAADHDKPQDTLGGLGAGEYYARKSGCIWMQPEALEDFNDMHQREGLRAVALRLREG